MCLQGYDGLRCTIRTRSRWCKTATLAVALLHLRPSGWQRTGVWTPYVTLDVLRESITLLALCRLKDGNGERRNPHAGTSSPVGREGATRAEVGRAGCISEEARGKRVHIAEEEMGDRRDPRAGTSSQAGATRVEAGRAVRIRGNRGQSGARMRRPPSTWSTRRVEGV